MATLLPADLASTLHLLGLDLGRTTHKEVWALCPVHYERTGKHDSKPKNFSVNLSTGWAFCFACEYKADIYKLVRDVRGCNHWEAIGWLRENGASVVDLIERVRTEVSERDAMPRAKDKTGKMLAHADPDMEFVLLQRPPEFQLDERDLAAESAETYMVRWKDGGWVLPFTDERGKVHGWQVKAKTFVVNHPHDPKRPERSIKKSEFLFGRHCFRGDRLIVVESPLDAVRIHTAGYDGAVATFGSYVSTAQVRMMLEMASTIVIAMDNDEAGWRSAVDLAATIGSRAKVKVCSYAKVPDVKDPGDLTDAGIDLLFSDFVNPIELGVKKRERDQAAKNAWREKRAARGR